MPNQFEKGPERIPTKAEVLEVISRYAENPTLVRELSDERGLTLLEVQVKENVPGDTTEYLYIRKGVLSDSTAAGDTQIHIVRSVSGIPRGGNPIATYKSETGEWEEIK